MGRNRAKGMNTQAINQRNFASTIQDLVRRLDAYFTAQNTIGGGGAYAEKEALTKLVDSVMFGCKEGKQPTKLSSFNELDLVNELCAYCNRQKIEYVRYCVFDLIFTMVRPIAKEYRRRILVLLTSLAIALKSNAVLECVALWLATSHKEHTLHLVSCLEKDFCTVMPESAAEVKACGKVCEKFCSMLMSACCTKYKMKDPNSDDLSRKVDYPPVILLDIVQHWLLKNPGICFSVITRMDQLWHTVLTTTRAPENSIPLSPLAGLIQWSVKLPFAPDDFGSKILECENLVKDSYTTLQSGLHFGVLTSMLVSKECLNAIKQGVLGKESDLQLWSKSDAHLLVGGLLAYQSDNPDPKSTTLAVDRFSQISQIAQTSHILNCSKEQFQSLTDPLPKTKLLELVAYGPQRKPSIDDIPM